MAQDSQSILCQQWSVNLSVLFLEDPTVGPKCPLFDGFPEIKFSIYVHSQKLDLCADVQYFEHAVYTSCGPDSFQRVVIITTASSLQSLVMEMTLDKRGELSLLL